VIGLSLVACHWQASITVTSHSVSDKGGRFVAARIVYMHIINLQLIIHRCYNYPQLHWQPQAERLQPQVLFTSNFDKRRKLD